MDNMLDCISLKWELHREDEEGWVKGKFSHYFPLTASVREYISHERIH